MRFVRRTIGTWLAAMLLTLSIGLQVLEASGQWDRTFQDSGDEAAIVTIVLCIGAALLVAAVAPRRISLSAIYALGVTELATAFEWLRAVSTWSASSTSPPISLRI